ncbi:MAG TPA: hypothetical protein VKY19_27435 [Ktedonosporobacter sp.]|nr:hypothetical protein [Ktedonosporobacter sp.]
MNNPKNGDPIRVNTKTGKVIDGNGRSYELQRRAALPGSSITPDTPIFYEPYTPSSIPESWEQLSASGFSSVVVVSFVGEQVKILTLLSHISRRRVSMTEREYILQLMYRAFLDIRVAAYSQDSHACFVLADIFHNVPLQIAQADQNKMTYADMVAWVQQKCEEKKCKGWLDTATSDIVNNEASS